MVEDDSALAVRVGQSQPQSEAPLCAFGRVRLVTGGDESCINTSHLHVLMCEHARARARLFKRAPRLARRRFLALDTRIDEPLIGIALHGRDAKHLQTHHLKDRLQLPELSWYYRSHQTAQRRWRGRATDPILHRNLRQHAAIVFVRQLAFPDIWSQAKPHETNTKKR